MLTLITGGIRSGKSSYALELARQTPVLPKYFVATAEPMDEEIKLRIARHKQERSQDFITIEEPLYLGRSIDLASQTSGLMLVDCMTLWVNNLLYHFEKDPARMKMEIDSFLTAAGRKKLDMIFVTNEVGLGLVSENALSRRYVDELGYLNQALAKICDEVVLMVSGIPSRIKGAAHARLGN